MTHLMPDRLSRSVEQLEYAVEAGSDIGHFYWVADLGSALIALSHALRIEKDAEDRGRGPLSPVEDTALETNPTQDRQVESMRARQQDLLDIVDGFEIELQSSLQQMRHLGPTEREYETQALRAIARDLMEAVREYQLDETNLVLCAMNTDIGVGD